MRLIIAGTRTFTDYHRLCATADLLNGTLEVKTVVCGGASGADELGKRWAEERGIPVEHYPADWDKHGPSAGPIRNVKMAQNADYLLVFWDGVSRGTKHMMKAARQLGVPVHVEMF